MPKITPAKSPVSEALILICEKCGKKLSNSDENPARALQAALKEKIKSDGNKGVIRAVITSCMDVCPKDEIAIAVSKAGGPSGCKDTFFTLKSDHPEDEAQTVLNLLLE
jgi:predicted metal-binding protein